MSDTLDTVSDAEWAELARESGMDPAAFKELVLKGAEADDGFMATAPAGGAVTVEGPCQITPFSAGIWKIIACRGEIRLCGPEDDWSAEVEITFLLADVPVKTVKYRLAKRNSEISDSYSLVAIRASYTIGMRSDGWCLYVKGSFGYLTFTGWKDHNVKKDLFCFGRI